jgi:hypothetical protein
VTQRRRLAGLTGGAQAEQLEAVLVDAVARAPGHLEDDGAESFVRNVRHPPAARADDVMVMERLTDHVRMLAARQVDPLDRIELDEDVERAEDGCAAKPQAPGTSVGDQIGRREVAVVFRDE